LLHLVGSSVLLYLIDDARSNTNQVQLMMFEDRLVVADCSGRNALQEKSLN